MSEKENNRIAFQGVPGAYSNLACREAFPHMEPLPCPTFEDAFAAVEEGKARLAMIPIENSLAGRVADIHQLLPHSDLHIVGEHFLRVNHHLLAPQNASLESLREVRSHVQALGQCRDTLRKLNLKPVPVFDTAGAAEWVAEQNDPRFGAIASSLAAEIYGLKSIRTDIEDAQHNTTRFVVMSRVRVEAPADNGPTMMTFVFQVRNVPAALYKALGGFATNGVNMTKLESYQIGGAFTATQFYADIEGHPDERRVQLAMEELGFFTTSIRVFGVYPAHKFRFKPS